MQVLLDSGVLSLEQAEESPVRNVILQAMGHQPDVDVALSRLELRDRDCLVLCSDGLTTHVSDDEIREVVLAGGRPETIVHRLVGLANGRGGRDNVTVVVAGVGGELEGPRSSETFSRRSRCSSPTSPSSGALPLTPGRDASRREQTRVDGRRRPRGARWSHPKSRAPKSRAPKSHPPKCRTVVEVLYPEDRGAIGLRGSVEPLSWETTLAPTRVEDDRHVFELEVPWGALLELKVVRNDEEWASGRNYTAHAGDHLSVEPTFDACAASLELGKTIASPAGELRFDVLLPPSYGEQTRKRYPCFTCRRPVARPTSEDPSARGRSRRRSTGSTSSTRRYFVVVGGTPRRTASADARRAGPHGRRRGRLLDAIVGFAHEHVDATYRTRPRAHRYPGIVARRALQPSTPRGSGRTFGKAGCLEPPWWADRWMVRRVQDADAAPEPRRLTRFRRVAEPGEGSVRPRRFPPHALDVPRAGGRGQSPAWTCTGSPSPARTRPPRGGAHATPLQLLFRTIRAPGGLTLATVQATVGT